MRDGVSVSKYRRRKKEKRSPPTIPEPKPSSDSARSHEAVASPESVIINNWNHVVVVVVVIVMVMSASLNTYYASYNPMLVLLPSNHALFGNDSWKIPNGSTCCFTKKNPKFTTRKCWLKEMTGDWQLPG